MTSPSRPHLVTHGGKFHCDEVFAYVVLRLALGLEAAPHDHTLRRTRDADAIAAADVVFDVGGVSDPAAGRFDHHQRGAPARPDGTPFSSAGLVWQVHGEAAVAALLRRPEGPLGGRAEAERFAAPIAHEVDNGLVRRIDEVDNGMTGGVMAGASDPLGLAALVGEFNPPWDDPAGDGPEAGDAAFAEAVAFVAGVLGRRVEMLRARLDAEAAVLAAYAAAADPRILVLERGMPWKTVVLARDLPVLFVVAPTGNGQWTVGAVPPEPGSFAQKRPLPESWAGLQGAALAEASGVPDAVFVHLRRFIGAAGSCAGAIAMARAAL